MIDHQRLDAICQGAQGTRAKVIADFRQANAVDATCLHLACGSSDFPRIALLAHRIKGACLMLGATGLAEACSLLALAGRAESDANAREAMACFDREAALLGAYLQALPDAGAMAAPPPAVPARPCEGLHFVVAEDHDFQRDLIVRLLRNMGAQSVCGVDNGARALHEINQAAHPVDVLVLDLSMPGMDSSELLQRVAEGPRPVAVILNSALGPTMMSRVLRQVAAFEVRILGAVSKPLTERALSKLMEAYRGRTGGS